MTRLTICCRARLLHVVSTFHSYVIPKTDARGEFLHLEYAAHCHNARSLLLLRHSYLDAEGVVLLLQYTLPCLGARPLELLLNGLQNGYHNMTWVTICCGARLFCFA